MGTPAGEGTAGPAPAKAPVPGPAAAPDPASGPPEPEPGPRARPRTGRRRQSRRRGWLRSGSADADSGSADADSTDAPPGPSATRGEPPATLATPSTAEHRLVSTLVRRLLPVIGHVQAVRPVSAWVLDSVLEIVPAEAGALLLPDEGRWRVHADVALRDRERRQTLTPSHWLVTQLVEGRQGLIVEDTDIARIRLQDSPLASWRNLLAAPVPEAGGILLLAREGTRFTGPDLAAVVRLLAHVAPRLVEALEARELARLIEPLLDRPTD